MRLCKLILLLLLATSASAQYVQPMGYKDYSFPWQANFGSEGVIRTTNPAAYTEFGTANSKKGILWPRGYKDSLAQVTLGLVIYDIPTKKYWYHDGTSWQMFGEKVDSLIYATRNWVLANTSNLYTADGALPAGITRTVTLNGSALSFEHANPDGTGIYHLYDPVTRSMISRADGINRHTVFYQDDQTLQLFAQAGSTQSQFNLLINGDMQFENTNGHYRFTYLPTSRVTVNTDPDMALWMDAEGYLFKKAGTTGITAESDPVATAKIGDLTTLTTTNKTTVVDAIKENTASIQALQPQAVQTLSDGVTITWNYSLGAEAKVTLAGNRTLSITNLPTGKVAYLTLNVTQDATGSRTITLPTGTKVINGGAGAVTLTTTGGATDLLTFRWNGATLYCTYGKNYN